MRKLICLFGLVGLGVFALYPVRVSSGKLPAMDWRAKVDPKVLAASANGQTEFIIYMAQQADLSGAAALATKEEKGRHVFEQLTAVAQATQPPVKDTLNRLGVEYQSFWVTNSIWVKGDVDVVQAVALRPEVAYVYPSGSGSLTLPPQEESRPSENVLAADPNPEPNLIKVNADDVWAMGYLGQGVVVASADTGVFWQHAALKNRYRGWNGTAANHNYNWHDAIHNPNAFCPGDSPEPCDDDELLGGGHGSHTTGTMVGDDGGNNRVGMAPEAKWIACRNLNNGVGAVPTYMECMQWFIAPTNIANQNPDPTRAPHVINNSWGCVEGCPQPLLQDTLRASRAAGIFYAVSAGNDGSECNTLQFPLARYPESFTVGATSHVTDLIASFSSRGSVLGDPNEPTGMLLKPNISAPGVGVRSCQRDGSYAPLSGTSMAGPHVAGLVALLINANPRLAGRIDRLEDIIEQTPVRKTTTEGCGGDTPTAIPNNVYGWGRIDALAATLEALPPDAIADTATTFRETPVVINVLANDTDPDGDALTVTAAGPAGQGTVTINGDGTLTYSPAAGFIGMDTFSYTICAPEGCETSSDTATVAVEVREINAPPLPTNDAATTSQGNPVTINVVANDSDPNGNPLTVTAVSDPPNGAASINAGQTVTYTPDAGFSGIDTFSYTVSDGNGGTATANVTVTVIAAGLQYYPLARPVRLLDTRAGQPACDTPGAPLTGGTDRTQQARTTCDGQTLPANALAIVGNATVDNNRPGTEGGFITLYPADVGRPAVSNLNYVAGQVVPNAFVVGLGASGPNAGAFNIFASSTTDVIIDVTGYYAPPGTGGLYYHALPRPVRLLDTRSGEPACDTPGQPLTGGQARTQPARTPCTGIPQNARAIVGNSTAVADQPNGGSGFVTLYPSGAERPTVSNLNFVPGQVVPNSFTVGLGEDGAFKLYAHQGTSLNIVVDVTGYYSDQATNDGNSVGLLYFSLPTPLRLLDTRAGQMACDSPGQPLAGNSERTQAARVTCQGVTIPASALAVVGNATVINTTQSASAGFATLYPTGVARPNVSNLNYVAGQVVPNMFVVGLGGDGAFRIYPTTEINFIVDIAGFFAP